MFTRLRVFLSRFKKVRNIKPLVPHTSDIELVRRVRGHLAPNWRQFWHIGKILSTHERRLLLASVAVFGLSAVWFAYILLTGYRVSQPAIGGRYVEGAVGAPELINPLFASLSDVDADMTRLVYSGLFRYDEGQRLVPDLAAGYTMSDDKKTYTIKLRQDVFWHDGEPFSAEDVVFTIETIQNPNIGSPLLLSFQGVLVTVIDPHTVQLTLQEPFPAFLSALTVGLLPEHLWIDVPPERLRFHKLNLQPVGTGPFKFDRLLKDETGYIYRYELVRNDRFYREGPYIAQFDMQFFGEYDGPTGAIQAFRENRIDGLSFVPHDIREKVERKHIRLHTVSLPQYTALFLNQDHNPLLKDKVVREALERSLDKERILHESLKDEGEAITGPILPGSPGFIPDATTTPYTLEIANQLLDATWARISAEEYREMRRTSLLSQLGIASTASSSSSSTPVDVSNTSTQKVQEIEDELRRELPETQTFYRKDKQGHILEMTVVTAETPEYERVAKLVAGFWQEIGVKTNIRLVHPNDIVRLSLRHRDYDVLLYGLILGADPDQYPFWHSSQIEFPGLNLSRYVNRNVDELLVRARESTDPSVIAESYAKFQDILNTDRAAIFLYTPTYTYATNDNIFGISATPIFHPSDRLNGVTGWYVKTKGVWRR